MMAGCGLNFLKTFLVAEALKKMMMSPFLFVKSMCSPRMFSRISRELQYVIWSLMKQQTNPWLTEFWGDRSLQDLQHIMQGRCLPSEHLGKDQHGFVTRFFFFVGGGGRGETQNMKTWKVEFE